MKKSLFLFLVIFTIAAISGCEKTDNNEPTTDVVEASPIVMNIFVVNRNGKNILDESYKGNVLDYDIEMTFNDCVYELVKADASRTDEVTFDGLRLA
ncbi:MAG: hypothetical protein R3Y08_03755 [Rikenellaceae bacterium]